jgi:4-amino-4-deoxy-L-arabinose transferase-like glycosyltransferase
MTGPATTARQRLLFTVVLLAVAALRLSCLQADPAPSMPDAAVMDEGLWADSARAHALFGDWFFGSDVGNVYLIAPLYTWLMSGVYALFGVGLWQTRLLSAIASIGTALLGGRYVAARAGLPSGTLATALIGVCPLLDQHGHFALLESTQGFFLLLAFSLLFPRRARPWKAALAGAALGAAFLVKPNTVYFGALPFGIAFAVTHWRARRAGDRRSFAAEAAALCTAGTAVVLALGLPVWLRHWDWFWDTVRYESGSANWTLGKHLLRLGLAFSRENDPGEHFVWGLLRHAAVCCLGAWLLIARRAAGIARPPLADALPLWIWILASLVQLELGFDHATRRQVLFLPAMAMLTAHALATRRAPPVPAAPWRPLPACYVLLFPLLVLAKPLIANAAAYWFAPEGSGNETAGTLGGLVALAALLALPAAFAALRWQPQAVLELVDRRAPAGLFALVLIEATRLAVVPPHDYSVREEQDRLGALVQPDEVVLGEHAATLFQTARVHTVRCVMPGRQYSSPRPNPDVAKRLRPRYVIDYADPSLSELTDVTAIGFERKGRVGLLREANHAYRFVLEFWERQ